MHQEHNKYECITFLITTRHAARCLITERIYVAAAEHVCKEEIRVCFRGAKQDSKHDNCRKPNKELTRNLKFSVQVTYNVS